MRSYFGEYVSDAEFTDPLGLGTHLWTAQWLPSVAESGVDTLTLQAMNRYKQRLVAAIPSVLERNLTTSLPFRLYGTLLGAQVLHMIRNCLT